MLALQYHQTMIWMSIILDIIVTFTTPRKFLTAEMAQSDTNSLRRRSEGELLYGVMSPNYDG